MDASRYQFPGIDYPARLFLYRKMNVMQRRGFVLGLMVSMLLFALATLGIVLFFNQPSDFVAQPVLLDNSVKDRPLCPGEEEQFTVLIQIEKPVIIQIASSITNAQEGFTIPGTQVVSLPYPHHQPKSFDQTIRWIVPDVPPGDYYRVTGFIDLNSYTQPEFIVIPFSVADCKE